MTIICYEIDPLPQDQFNAYADYWARIIRRLSRHLVDLLP